MWKILSFYIVKFIDILFSGFWIIFKKVIPHSRDVMQIFHVYLGYFIVSFFYI